MNQMAAGAQQQTALNDFNVVCCFCVVLVHALSPGITQAEPHSWQMAVIYFPWLAARFSVAGFLFVSGIKMGLSFAKSYVAPYSLYIRRRIQRVLIPYLLWTFIYYICFYPIGYVNGNLSELFYFLWSGTLSAQFYYIFIAMQFYLLRPFWFWLLKRTSPIMILLSSYFLMLIAGNLLDQAAIMIPGTTPLLNRIFLRYLLYWMTGLYAGQHYERFLNLLCRKGVIHTCFALLAVYYLSSYLEFLSGSSWLLLQILKPIFNLAAVFLLLHICHKIPGKFRPVLDFFYQASLFVFFSHCLILTIGTFALYKAGVTQLFLLLSFRILSGFSLPLLSYCLIAVLHLKIKRIQ